MQNKNFKSINNLSYKDKLNLILKINLNEDLNTFNLQEFELIKFINKFYKLIDMYNISDLIYEFYNYFKIDYTF